MKKTAGRNDGFTCQLSVVIAAYAEADNLRELLPVLTSVTSRLTNSAEILVIDSHTPVDDTKQVCDRMGVTWIPRELGNNYGDAIRTGIRASRGEYILTMDADGSHNPRFIPALWEKRLVADVVIASRYIPGGATDNPWLLVSLSRLLNVLFEHLVGTPVLDVSNSFRLYRGDLLRGQRLDGLHFDILEEALVKIVYADLPRPARIIELPYHFEQRKHGKSKRNLFVFGLRYITAMYHLRRFQKKHGRKGIPDEG